MEASASVRVEVVDFVATVTLCRAPVNAADRPMRSQLIATFDNLSERKDVRSILMLSSCRAFCAGVDLRDRPDPNDAGDLTSTHRLTRETFNAVRECAKPVVVGVNGAAIGFGVALAAACDIILAADDATFAMAEINVGLAGGVSMLQSWLPRSKARELLFTGDPVSASALGAMGVVECVPAAELHARAEAVARKIAGKSPTAIRYAKRSANFAELMAPGEAYKFEQHYTTALASSVDGMEARRAFLEKRAPRFVED